MALQFERGELRVINRACDLALKELYRQITRKMQLDASADLTKLNGIIDEISEIQDRIDLELGV